ncbi:DNA-processing protein DprA [Suttonella sp. R2A3]|uniref:DNA-processing protein DprA n=1 Tax=Suttonella sp. R2A3 TaxID=2908648 RepID=UPI001F4110ED|nr:DNA-processing protein DprA [Suttonella sp. R2A3]UJF24177.1 DNA-processing protein DprA [Suttonella sp. R2A3]
MSEGLKAWCSLWRAPGIGPATFQQILQACGSPEAFFHASEAMLNKQLGSAYAKRWQVWRQAPEAGQTDLDWAAEDPLRYIITLEDSRYPSQLREIADPPPLLFVYGEIEALNAPQMAIIGSRNASQYGLRNSRYFASALAGAGLVVTSGMALGIDGAAHQAALAAGGKTIAVVATGLDRVYPAAHHQLAKEIVAQGAMVSEMPIGSGVRRHNFPRRNRIISGLSLGVLVVEASQQSGSLTTARQALEQGRDVFAIPGSIHDPMAKGCHTLIKQGAILVEDVTDITAQWQALLHSKGLIQSTSKVNLSPTVSDPQQATLLAALGHDPCHIDELSERIELTNEEISAMLLLLELDGLVERMPGGRYRRLG